MMRLLRPRMGGAAMRARRMPRTRTGGLGWLLAVYPGRRLEALAELLTKAGTNCPSPALDAQPVGPEPGAIWYVECKDGWHTYINYGGNPVVMDGKVNVQDMTK
jgi:hypothetical protein